MERHLLRIEVDDVLGTLTATASALGVLGVDILELAVDRLGGGRRIDEFLLDFTVPLDLPAVAVAVQGAGATVLDLRAADASGSRLSRR